MADKQQVTLHRSFAYTDKDKKVHYFTQDNAGTIADIVSPDHMEAYANNGLISFGDVVTLPEPGPTEISAPEKASGTTTAHAGIKPASANQKER